MAAEEHYVDSSIVGLIPVDSIYTPIKNVRYKIENTRVEQRTDFEKLIIDVKTDGTIHPEDAVKEAIKASQKLAADKMQPMMGMLGGLGL